MIDPVAVVSIHNVFTGENANITENEDIRTISNILCGDAWNTEGTTDCLSNIEITINEETYKYHSDCGTFNDNVNQNYLSLDDERKAVVNAIFQSIYHSQPQKFQQNKFYKGYPVKKLDSFYYVLNLNSISIQSAKLIFIISKQINSSNCINFLKCINNRIVWVK